MTPARRRQLLQRLASQQTASGVALIRREAEAEEARESFKPVLQTARENPDPTPLSERLIRGALAHYEAHQAAAQLEELAAAPIDSTTAEKLAEVLRPLPDPPAQDAPRRPRKRRKPKTARRGRPPLAEAGGAAERLSVSLAPETLAAIARAARRRKVRPGTVLRELAEAWASSRD